MGAQIYVTVKEQISGSEGRCGEREVNRGLNNRDRKKNKTDIKMGRYEDPVKF